jgi:hypothetical protein
MSKRIDTSVRASDASPDEGAPCYNAALNAINLSEQRSSSENECAWGNDWSWVKDQFSETDLVSMPIQEIIIRSAKMGAANALAAAAWDTRITEVGDITIPIHNGNFSPIAVKPIVELVEDFIDILLEREDILSLIKNIGQALSLLHEALHDWPQE